MASISIDRPVDEVFDFVTDVDNMPRWISGVSGARLVSKQWARALATSSTT